MSTATTSNWMDYRPEEILQHGPSKRYIDRYWWIDPHIGIAATYRVQVKDVEDHFNVFRGVDMIESAAQTGVTACTIRESLQSGYSIDELKTMYKIAFMGMGEAKFYGYVSLGDVLLNICTINRYKFKQMSISCNTFKVVNEGKLSGYFEGMSPEEFLDRDFRKDFELVASFENLLGRAVRNEKINN
jgi:hypothetical protein